MSSDFYNLIYSWILYLLTIESSLVFLVELFKLTLLYLLEKKIKLKQTKTTTIEIKIFKNKKRKFFLLNQL